MKSTGVLSSRTKWRRLRGGFIGLLAVTIPLELAAAEKAVATAQYSGGALQLSASRQTLRPSGGNDRSKVQLNLEFEVRSENEAGGGSGGKRRMPALPENFYLNNPQSPLVAAYAQGENENLATQRHVGQALGAGPWVMITFLHVALNRERLERVEIELELVKVTEWETLQFLVGLGPSDFLQCGPFELKATGAGNELMIDSWEYPEFKQQHEDYKKRMPLRFLASNLWVTTALKPVDASGATPNGTSERSTVTNWKEGALSTTYRGWSKGAISYPVTLTLKMPKRYETEKVRFYFDKIDLDSAAAAKVAK